MLKLVFQGRLRSLAPPSLDAVERPASVDTLQQLRDWLVAEAPTLGAALSAMPVRLVHNHTVAHDLSATLQDGDEIAFLPPMSGG